MNHNLQGESYSYHLKCISLSLTSPWLYEIMSNYVYNPESRLKEMFGTNKKIREGWGDGSVGRVLAT